MILIASMVFMIAFAISIYSIADTFIDNEDRFPEIEERLARAEKPNRNVPK